MLQPRLKSWWRPIPYSKARHTLVCQTSSAVPVSVSSGAPVDPASLFHEFPKPSVRFPATSDIPQRTAPFADRFVVDAVPAGAADNCRKSVCALVEWHIGKFEDVPQQSIRSTPYSVMRDNSKNGLQVAVHAISPPIRLKLSPGTLDLLKSSPQTSLWSLISRSSNAARVLVFDNQLGRQEPVAFLENQ
jgi:hypothetical protein